MEYQLEVAHGEYHERINDPLNRRLAHSPVGSSSVCYATGYEVRSGPIRTRKPRPGTLVDLVRAAAARCAATAR